MRKSSPSFVVKDTSGLREVRLALIGNWSSLLIELLGKPQRRTARQWRWNRHGSLSAVVSGAKLGTWFDHERGIGGGPLELIAREQNSDWRGAADWARRWLGMPQWQPSRLLSAQDDAAPILLSGEASEATAVPSADEEMAWEEQQRFYARRAATMTWEEALPADPAHLYLQRKGVKPYGIRMELLDVLLVPLRDLDGTIHTLQRIYEDGTKRFLSGGAKAGHFTLIGEALENAHGILLCEGWATGATAHEATGLPVIAAMDAGNLLRVAPLIHDRFPDATLVILADNDLKPGRDTNPGVNAAMTAARATNALIAIPSIPGDFNDLAAAGGIDAVRREIWAAAPPPKLSPTYPLPTLDLMTVRGRLDDQMAEFMADVATYWGDNQPDADLVPQVPWAASSTSEATMPRGTACC